jgi:hypothetical protein
MNKSLQEILHSCKLPFSSLGYLVEGFFLGFLHRTQGDSALPHRRWKKPTAGNFLLWGISHSGIFTAVSGGAGETPPCLTVFACKNRSKSCLQINESRLKCKQFFSGVSSRTAIPHPRKKQGKGAKVAFAIMRMQKIKSASSLKFAAQHNTRERQPLNADETKKGENWLSGGSTAEVMEKYRKALESGKVRKNAIHAVEILMTASPEFDGNWTKYLNACDKWACEIFGKSNVLHIAHHRDESTPHTHVLVVPMKDGKLNANFFIGGPRDRMAQLQSDFYEKVGKGLGLLRGQSASESRSRHSHHSLAGKALELEEREKILREKESNMEKILGLSTEEILANRKDVQIWDSMTPDQLQNFAKLLETRGFKTVKEYRVDKQKKMEEQKNKNKQKTGLSGSGKIKLKT